MTAADAAYLRAKRLGNISGKLEPEDYAMLHNMPRGALIDAALKLAKMYDDANPDIGIGPSLGTLAKGVWALAAGTR